MSEVTKLWMQEGYEKGLAEQSLLTEKEKQRADAAESRAEVAEAEAEKYKKLLAEAGIQIPE